MKALETLLKKVPKILTAIKAFLIVAISALLFDYQPNFIELVILITAFDIEQRVSSNDFYVAKFIGENDD